MNIPLLPSIIAPHQLIAMGDLASNVPPGDFAEVGVFRGGSASLLYRITEAQNRKLHLFDTFRGTPFHVEGLDKHKIDDEFFAKDAPAAIHRSMPNAIVHIGIYPHTHPEGLKDLAFVHCDCDQYESYRAVIDTMWPLVVRGGVLLFDDYPYLGGAKKAVEESFDISQLRKCAARYYVVKEA